MKTYQKRKNSCNNFIYACYKPNRIVTRVYTLLISFHYAWCKILLSDAYIFFRDRYDPARYVFYIFLLKPGDWVEIELRCLEQKCLEWRAEDFLLVYQQLAE